MADETQQLFRDAIGRNCGLVISLPSAGMVRHHKSRFLAEDAEGFWIESVPAEAQLIDELIGSGRPAGISFKGGATKVIFTAPVLRRESAYRINATATVEALLVRHPTELKAIQRRGNYRVTIAEDSGVSVRIWRISEHAYLNDRPMAAQEIPARLRNLSVGGVGVVFLARERERNKVKEIEYPRVTTEDRLRIQLSVPGNDLLLEGRMRYPEKCPKDAREVRAGIQFKALETNLQGRQVLATLTRVVGEMQRAEARRYRLGIA